MTNEVAWQYSLAFQARKPIFSLPANACIWNSCKQVNKFQVQLYVSWWRYQMETFSALLTICAGNSPVPGEFPAQRPVTRSFDVSFDLRLNKRLSKQSWGWWFKTLSRPLWRHRNDYISFDMTSFLVNMGMTTLLHRAQNMAILRFSSQMYFTPYVLLKFGLKNWIEISFEKENGYFSM